MKHPNLNEQKDSKKLMLFRNGVTSYETFVNSLSGFIFFGKVVFWIL